MKQKKLLIWARTGDLAMCPNPECDFDKAIPVDEVKHYCLQCPVCGVSFCIECLIPLGVSLY